MHCSCRAAPLRTFINGLAQVHRLEYSPAPRSYIAAGRSKLCIQAATDSGLRRGFHSSSVLSNIADDSDVAVSKIAKPEEAGRSAVSDSPSSTSPSSSGGNNSMAYANRGGNFTPRDSRAQAGKGGFRSYKNPRTNANDSTTSFTGNSRWRRGGSNTDADTASHGGAQGRGDVTGDRPRARKWTDQPAQSRPYQGRNRNPYARDGPDSNGTSGPGQEGPKKEVEQWRIQKEKLKAKFPDGWKPLKRLSPDALAGIRALNAQFPDVYTTQKLAEKFEVSPENIRRILKSHWQPSVDEEQDRQERWHRRGMQIWEHKAALGVKPPRKWRAEGITRDPRYHDRRRARIQQDRAWEEEENDKYRAYREGLNKAAGKVV